MPEILLEASRREYSNCGTGHSLIREPLQADRLVNRGLASDDTGVVLAAMHQSGHQFSSQKALLPAARGQIGLLKELSFEVGKDQFGERGVTLLGRAVYTASMIIGPDSEMASDDIENVIEIFRDFLDARGDSEGSERAKADLAGITAFSLGEFGNNGALRSFLKDVYNDRRLGLNTELSENQRSSETRKLLLHAIAYRSALNQLILDALYYGDIDEVSIAVGRIDEYASLLRQNKSPQTSGHGDWVESFKEALRYRAGRNPECNEVINPLNARRVRLLDVARVVELSLLPSEYEAQ